MRIQYIRVNVCIMVFLMLLFAIIATGVESKWEGQEPLLTHMIRSGQINQETAELLWINCRVELLHATKTIQDLQLDVIEDGSSNSEKIFVSRSSRRKMHENKQILLDCLRKKSTVLCTSGEERGSDAWYTRYLGLFNRRNSFRRRNLAEQLPGGVSDQRSSREESHNQTVIIAVVVTASITLVVAVVLFVCFSKCCGSGSGRGKNDERPLLSLSLSDYSVASSQKLHGVGTTTNGEKLGSLSINSKLSHNKNSGNFYVDSLSLSFGKDEIPGGNISGAAANSAENVVPLSPGILEAHGLPPLKPPPGRTDPPKHPPITTSLLLPTAAPSPPTTAPPPPPAPAPPLPPTLRPSGGPRPPPPAPRPQPPGPLPIPSGAKAGPRPPPPPGAGVPPPRPPPPGLRPPRSAPPGPRHPSASTSEDGEADGPKTKLKPFFWDKVSANPDDDSMVWNQLKQGSFVFNEEMIESLFGINSVKHRNDIKKESPSQDPSNQYIKIIDTKKAQNLSIMLKALNVTNEEVCDALKEGNELPTALIENLIKMAPTTEEELKLRLYSGPFSQLGPAERFLKVLVDIPFAFKRLESLYFMCNLQDEVKTLRESFKTLEAACTELRKSRLFLKLLEAVLKTGNRMNDGTFRGRAQAFKLDTLLKLSDVKGTDGKTTLLHFVVQEIIRSEGIRAARAAKEIRSMSSFKSEDLIEDATEDSDEHLRSMGLQVVSGLGNDLANVKNAAGLDADNVTGTVAKLGHALVKARDFVNTELKSVDEGEGFYDTLSSFVQAAEVDVMWLLEEEKRIMALVKNTADYFHGNAGKDEGLRLFVIVRDFLVILDKVCREVKNTPRKVVNKAPKKVESSTTASADPQKASNDDSSMAASAEAQKASKDDSSCAVSADPQNASKDDSSTMGSADAQKACKDDSSNAGSAVPQKVTRDDSSTAASTDPQKASTFSDPRQRLFPAIAGMRMGGFSSSDSESESDDD